MMEAACVLLINTHGQVLGVSRKNNTSQFGLPGGKVDPGETRKEAAIRECKEETGLDVWDLRPALSRDVEGIEATTFYARYDASQKIRPATGESGAVKWVTWVDLLRGPFGDYNKKLLEKLVAK